MNTPTTRNITRAFRLATDADRAAGRDWYQLASTLAHDLAGTNSPDGRNGAERDADYVRAAAVIAVLSPRLSWARNVIVAREAYALHAELASGSPSDELDILRNTFVQILPVLKANALKAWRLLSGEDPADVVGGDKVTTFWHTIVDPTDPRAVVIDRHALDIACNAVQSDAERGKLLGKRAAYAELSDLYRRAAKAVNADGRYGTGWTPAEVQAATWTYWRRERAAANHG